MITYRVRETPQGQMVSSSYDVKGNKDFSSQPMRAPRCHGYLLREGNTSRSDGKLLL